MNEQINDTINKMIQNNKELKSSIGEMNTALNCLGGALRVDIDKQVEDAYQRGFEDGKAQAERGCEECMYQDKTIEHHLCDKCCNAYNNMWTAKQTDDEIKVGDEVAFHHDDGRPDTVVVVTYIGQDGYIDGMDGRGTQYAHKNPTKWNKTGRHFDIDKILKEMQS